MADTLATLIIKLVADTAEITTGVKKAGDSFDSLTGMASKVGGMLAGMFTIGAVVSFGRSVLSAADSFQKMADQTGMTTEEIQRLNYVAGQSGSSMSSLVSAVQNLQQRLGDENTGAAGAIRKLGINLETLTKQGGYAQLTTLAGAIKAIEDPTERASAAAAIFGKSWKEILPAILAGMKEVGDAAPVMSDAAGKAADRAGDALARLKAQAIVAGGTLAENLEKLFAAFKGDFGGAGDGFDELRKKTATLQEALDSVKAPTLAATEGIKALGLSASEAAKLERELTESAQASIKVNEAQVAMLDKLWGRDLTVRAQEYLTAIDSMGGKLPTLKAGQEELLTVFTASITAMEETGRTGEAMYDKLIAKQRELSGLTKDGLLSSKQLGADPLWTGPSDIKPDEDVQAYRRMNDDLNAFLATQEAVDTELNEGLTIIGQYPGAHAAAAAAGVAGANDVTAAVGRMADAFQLAIPQGHSFQQGYANAGLMVHGSISGLRPKTAPSPFQGNGVAMSGFTTGGGGSGPGMGSNIVVHQTIQDSFMDTPGGAARMAQKSGASLVASLRSQGRSLP